MEGEIGEEREEGKRKTRKSRKEVGWGRAAMAVQTRCVKPTRHMTKDTIVNCGE